MCDISSEFQNVSAADIICLHEQDMGNRCLTICQNYFAKSDDVKFLKQTSELCVLNLRTDKVFKSAWKVGFMEIISMSLHYVELFEVKQSHFFAEHK